MSYELSPRYPYWLLLLLMLMPLCMLTSCRSQQALNTQHSTISTQRIEYRDRLTRDTTYVHDSIFIHQKNDTIYISKWRNKYVERIRIDTCYIQKSDTIRLVKRMYIKEPLTTWQTIKIKFGEILLIILLLLIAWIIIKLVHR